MKRTELDILELSIPLASLRIYIGIHEVVPFPIAPAALEKVQVSHTYTESRMSANGSGSWFKRSIMSESIRSSVTEASKLQLTLLQRVTLVGIRP
jgi:hypothetical protein